MEKLLCPEALSGNNSVDRNFPHTLISLNYIREFRIFLNLLCVRKSVFEKPC